MTPIRAVHTCPTKTETADPKLFGGCGDINQVYQSFRNAYPGEGGPGISSGCRATSILTSGSERASTSASTMACNSAGMFSTSPTPSISRSAEAEVEALSDPEVKIDVARHPEDIPGASLSRVGVAEALIDPVNVAASAEKLRVRRLGLGGASEHRPDRCYTGLCLPVRRPAGVIVGRERREDRYSSGRCPRVAIRPRLPAQSLWRSLRKVPKGICHTARQVGVVVALAKGIGNEQYHRVSRAPIADRRESFRECA